MDLDDRKQIKALDTLDMKGCIDGLPDQLEEAWKAGSSFPLPGSQKTPRHLVIAGMGGSAIGGTILATYGAPFCKIPILVWRDYNLPAWVQGPETLVIASSYSGNTEETLSAYEAAKDRKCSLLAMTTGGKLASLAEKDGVPLWKFVFHGQPRGAVGYTFALPLAVAHRLGAIPDPSKDVASAVTAMRVQQKTVGLDSPLAENPAKRLAQRWVRKNVIVLGSDYMIPIVRRWKGQVSEISKAWGQFEEIPELDHNTVAGTVQPREVIERSMVIFLQSKFNHPRNIFRVKVTRELFAQKGWATEVVEAAGETPLAHMYSSLHLGDYATFFLAMLYHTDPSPVAVIEDLKKRLVQ